MNLKRRRRRRGIALILAMFTAVILMTLSLAFMSLSMSESRTSRVYGYEEASIQAASFGLEAALVYMGHGRGGSGTADDTWKLEPWPNPGGVASLDFGFFNLLVPHTSRDASGMKIKVTDRTGNDGREEGKFKRLIPPGTSQADSEEMLDNFRCIYFVDASGNDVAWRLGPDLIFQTEVAVLPILAARNQGRHQYQLTATAKIYSLAEGQTSVRSQDVPVATRVVEARVKESSFDYAHFIANGRSWNAQGYSVENLPKVADPNDPSKVVDLTDYVMIPPTYTENGPMRVDGQDTSRLTGLPANDPYRQVVDNSGNLRFDQGANDGGVNFTHKLTIGAASNVYNESGLDDSQMGAFGGGFNPLQERVGIPDFRTRDMILGAQFRADAQDVSGYHKIETADIPGATGSTQPAPRGTDPDLGPFYKVASTSTLPDGTIVKTGAAFDFRPRFPQVEVTLSGQNIRIARLDTTTEPPTQIGPAQTINQSQLAMNTLYVEGGNVVVKSDSNPANRGFKGNLSIVAGESGRDNPNPSTASIYASAARKVMEYQKNRWDTDKRNGTLDTIGSYITPPYTAQQLRDLKSVEPFRSDPEYQVPSEFRPNQKLWPEPPLEVTNDGSRKYSVEREGNVVVASNVTYDGNVGNSLGLFAQNFVLLNYNPPRGANGEQKMQIDAIMMSKERSISLDWDNTGRQDVASWNALMTPQPDVANQRTIEIKGAVIGEYIDVEGDSAGRGFSKQIFTYDPSLRNASPPFMPRPDLASLPGGFRYMILHYLDRGSLSTAGVLQ